MPKSASYDSIHSECECVNIRKVLYIVSTLRRCSPILQLFNLIKYLDRSKFEPHLITLSPEPQDSRWADFQRLGVHLNALGFSRLKGVFLAKRRLEQKIEQIKPHIIHTNGVIVCNVQKRDE
jgi:hypothetical protein